MSIPHAKVIVNPVAGAYSTHRKWPRIRKLLSYIGLSFDYQYTEGAGHAIELARMAVNDGYRYIVAVGGDGTVNEVANGSYFGGGMHVAPQAELDDSLPDVVIRRRGTGGKINSQSIFSR